MKKYNLLLVIFVLLVLQSCSSDNEQNNIGSIVGTYNLISIESNNNLDPDATGEFNETEIFDNIDCNSSMRVNSDGSINWDYVDLSQTINSDSGTPTYSKILCQEINDVSGTYEISYDKIDFIFDDSIGVESTVLIGNLMKIKLTRNLVIDLGGTIQLSPVELTYTYEEE